MRDINSIPNYILEELENEIYTTSMILTVHTHFDTVYIKYTTDENITLEDKWKFSNGNLECIGTREL